MTKADQKKFQESIYYLKVDELKRVCGRLGLAQTGSKAELIQSVFKFYGLKEKTLLPKSFEKYAGKLSQETHILPGYYSNGQKSREIFKQLIGDHFHFTTYGMNWIKSQWVDEKYPTYKQFARFWQSEYDRRKSGESFKSADTNARVRFFRAKKGLGLSKDELEALWQKERKRNKAIVMRIIK